MKNNDSKFDSRFLRSVFPIFLVPWIMHKVSWEWAAIAVKWVDLGCINLVLSPFSLQLIVVLLELTITIICASLSCRNRIKTVRVSLLLLNVNFFTMYPKVKIKMDTMDIKVLIPEHNISCNIVIEIWLLNIMKI